LDSREALPEPISIEEPLSEGLRRVELITSVINLGFCAGNNVGMEFANRAGANYFLILNNDTFVEPTFLRPLIEAAEESENVGLIGGLICYAESPDTIWWGGGRFDSFVETKRNLDGHPISKIQCTKPFKTDWISGCMTLVPRTTF